MRELTCEWEDQLLEALGTGQWPHASGDALASHVSSCQGCTELLAVAGAILSDARSLRTEIEVPSAGAIWFRSQQRARREGIESASRILFLAQVGVATIGVVATFVLLVPTLSFSSTLSGTELVEIAHRWSLPLLAAGVACLTMTPVAAWIAFGKER